MARFLVVSWAGGGNEPPAIGIAQELRQRGHEVAFAGQDLGKGTTSFTEYDFRFAPLVRASAAWAEEPPDRRMVTAVMAALTHLRDLPDAVARERPDALLVDCLLFGVLAAAEDLGLPVAVLVHSPPGATAPPAGPREGSLLAPVNAVRASAGRPAVARLWDAWACFPSLCVTIPELDPLAGAVPPSFAYVGPVFPRVPPSGWRTPWPADDPRPLVLVSFSTTPGLDQSSRIRRTLDALAGRDCRVLVTTGAADVAGLPVPANAVLVRQVPHGEVLPHAAVVVTHAGHGTVAAALAHGLPLVCLPNPARDQPALAAQVAARGAGRALDGEAATAADIAAAVDQVLGDASYAAAARRLAAVIAATGGAATAASRLEHLVGHRASSTQVGDPSHGAASSR